MTRYDAILSLDDGLALERGGRLDSPAIAYRMWGRPLEDGSNVVWVCHALTANADVCDWWPGLFGSGCLFDPGDWCIICANVLGSCYGSTGPLSINPRSSKPYYSDFPELAVRDMVEAHKALARHLGLGDIALLIGGSLGGQQALEWAVQEPERFDRLVVLASNARHSPWGAAFNETQRMAIEADSTWGAPRPDAAYEGLKAARAIALLSYRHYEAYAKTQSPKAEDEAFRQPALSYQRYQGDKLARRFNAYSYHVLSRAMDSHDLGRGRGSAETALQRIQAETLVLSMSSDLLFPPAEQAFIASHIPRACHKCIESAFGHDGFLVETKTLAAIIEGFMSGLELEGIEVDKRAKQ